MSPCDALTWVDLVLFGIIALLVFRQDLHRQDAERWRRIANAAEQQITILEDERDAHGRVVTAGGNVIRLNPRGLTQ